MAKALTATVRFDGEDWTLAFGADPDAVEGRAESVLDLIPGPRLECVVLSEQVQAIVDNLKGSFTIQAAEEDFFEIQTEELTERILQAARTEYERGKVNEEDEDDYNNWISDNCQQGRPAPSQDFRQAEDRPGPSESDGYATGPYLGRRETRRHLETDPITQVNIGQLITGPGSFGPLTAAQWKAIAIGFGMLSAVLLGVLICR